jgi:hypothetical protein
VIKHAEPLHPGSVTLIGHDQDQLVRIEGTMPRRAEIPPGCPFHPRCGFGRCRQARPIPTGSSEMRWHAVAEGRLGDEAIRRESGARSRGRPEARARGESMARRDQPALAPPVRGRWR